MVNPINGFASNEILSVTDPPVVWDEAKLFL
jgi:hypothetical protein